MKKFLQIAFFIYIINIYYLFNFKGMSEKGDTMKITLGECLKIAKAIEEKIESLLAEREQVAIVRYFKDEEPEYPERTVEEISAEIAALAAKSRYLRQVVARANLNTKIDFEVNGEKISLAEGLLLLMQLLRERTCWKSLADKQQKTRNTDYYANVEYVEVTYDLAEAKKTYKNYEKQIRKLRLAIDRANINTEIEVPDDKIEY